MIFKIFKQNTELTGLIKNFKVHAADNNVGSKRLRNVSLDFDHKLQEYQ